MTPAAQRHDRCIAIVPSTEQCVENKLKRLPIFVAFAIRQDYGGNGIAGKRARQTIEVQWRNRFIGHDGDSAAANLACKKIAAIDQSLADMNGIATLAEIDLKSLHGAPNNKGG